MKRMLSLVFGVLLCLLLVSAGFAPVSQAASISPDAPASPSGVRKDLPPRCPIDWKPNVLLPVSSHSQFFDQSTGAPGPLQVFYPSMGRFADTPITSLLNCGQYPLVIFLHGERGGDPNVYLRWTRLPSMLARSGYVVVVPRLPGVANGTSPFESADLDYAKTVVTWMQNGWAYHDHLAASPRPAIVGHSLGAVLGARLAPQIGASAYVSLSAGWRLFNPREQEALSALSVPSLFAWGEVQDDFAQLENDFDPLWPTIKTLKHKLVFEAGTHWDYLFQAELPGSDASEFGRCALVPHLASEYTALFLSRYAPPADTNVGEFIPPSLLPPFPARTDLQAALAAGQFQGLDGVHSAMPECSYTSQLTEPTNPYGFRDATWPWLDRSAEFGTPDAEGWPTPAVIPGLNTYNIAYRDTSDHLHELWRDALGTGRTDLTVNANAPKAAGNPFAYVDTTHNKEILLYRDDDGTVHSLYWSTGAVGHDNLSGTAHAPHAADDPVGYYDAATDTHHVIYRSSNDHLHELWWHADETVQHGGDLTALAGAPAARGKPTAFMGYDGFNIVIYRGEDSHIRSLSWKGSTIPTDEDLSGVAGAPTAKGDPVGYYTAHNQTHQIVYRGIDWHVWELAWQGHATVVGSDIMTGLNVPFPDDKIAAYYSPGTNTKHVIFNSRNLGDTYMPHEIRWMPGGGIRARVDLWRTYGAPVATEGLAGFAVDSATSRHVTYRGWDSHIYELLLR